MTLAWLWQAHNTQQETPVSRLCQCSMAGLFCMVLMAGWLAWEEKKKNDSMPKDETVRLAFATVIQIHSSCFAQAAREARVRMMEKAFGLTHGELTLAELDGTRSSLDPWAAALLCQYA